MSPIGPRLGQAGRTTAIALAAIVLLAEPGGAQSPLHRAVEAARLAWLQHDFSGLVKSSDTMRLQLPEVGRAPAVRPAHAAQMLEEYLLTANEVAFDLGRIREASEGHAYAQLVRRYVVQGTSDERVETVFLGFRLLSGRWRLREVRITP